MLLSVSNPVDRCRTSHVLSTGQVKYAKLSKLALGTSVGLQTMFGRPQVVEISVENSLVHTKGHGLSTTTIEI